MDFGVRCGSSFQGLLSLFAYSRECSFANARISSADRFVMRAIISMGSFSLSMERAVSLRVFSMRQATVERKRFGTMKIQESKGDERSVFYNGI